MQTQTIQQVRPSRPRALRRLFLEVTHDEPAPAFVPPAETVPTPFTSDSGAVVETVHLAPLSVRSALLSVLSKESGLSDSDPRTKANSLARKALSSLGRAKRVVALGRSTDSTVLLSVDKAVRDQLSPGAGVSDTADLSLREVPLGYKAVVELFPVSIDPTKHKEVETALATVEQSVNQLESLADLTKTRFFKDGLTLAEACTFIDNFFASTRDAAVLADIQSKSSRNLKAHSELKSVASDDRGVDVGDGLTSRVHKTWSLMQSALRHKSLADNGLIFFSVLSSVQSQTESFGGELQHLDDKNKALSGQAAQLQQTLKEKAAVLSLSDFVSVSKQLDELENNIRAKLGI